MNKDRKTKFKLVLKLLRPYQWHKNVFVLAPIFFSFRFDVDTIYNVFVALCSFVLISSAAYSINDVFDVEKDKLHPVKKNRPVASGLISTKTALFVSFVLLAMALLLAIHVGIVHVILTYFLLNILYSIYLKDKKPIDIFIVSSGFVFRVIAGGMSCGIPPSSWLLMTTFFIAMFISSMKREAEYSNHSKIYEHVGVISATLTIIFYTMYIILERKESFLIVSVFPVMFGIIRYYIISEENKGKDPSLLLLDKQIIASGVLWVVIFLVSHYLKS